MALAAVLFSEPDLLLLDEPTNYLDLEGTALALRLSRALSAHRAGRSATTANCSTPRQPHPASRPGKLRSIAAAIPPFAKQFAEKRELTAKAKVKQDAERKHLQAFVDRFKAKASKARQAQSRVKRLAKLDPISTIVEDDVLPFDLPGPERMLAPPLIAVEGVAVGLWRPHHPRAAEPDHRNPMTASRCSAPTATANPPSASSSAAASRL